MSTLQPPDFDHDLLLTSLVDQPVRCLFRRVLGQPTVRFEDQPDAEIGIVFWAEGILERWDLDDGAIEWAITAICDEPEGTHVMTDGEVIHTWNQLAHFRTENVWRVETTPEWAVSAIILL